MPKFSVVRSTLIDAPADRVFSALNDFHTWPHWSPWLIAEPNATVNIAEDGKSYNWEGKRVGSGAMSIASEAPGKSIDYDLTFLKPWKSQAKTSFLLTPANDATKVSWTMDSSLPFFMFWMKNAMIAYIGNDYERGLALLKDYVENNGEVPSKLEFKGEEQFAGYDYIGIKTQTTQAKLGAAMMKDFDRLNDYASTNAGNLAGQPMSIYHKWDIVRKNVVYTAALPVKEVPNPLPDGFTAGKIPTMRTYTMRHVGPYAHLGNAWATMMMMQRNKEFKVVKGIHPFETYVNSPSDVTENELITDIRFAIK
ncbi:MAG: SRPBCC family protein [Bacteroidota bacterium]